MRNSVRAALERTAPERIGCHLHRARGASKLKSPPKAVRGSRKAEGGKSAGTMDESVTGSVNLFRRTFEGGPPAAAQVRRIDIAHVLLSRAGYGTRERDRDAPTARRPARPGRGRARGGLVLRAHRRAGGRAETCPRALAARAG